MNLVRDTTTNDDVLSFIHNILVHNASLNSYHLDRFDNETTWYFVKFLIDGEIMDYKPPSYFMLEKVYKMYYLVPDSLKGMADIIISKWKQDLCTDPDIYIASPEEQESDDVIEKLADLCKHK